MVGDDPRFKALEVMLQHQRGLVADRVADLIYEHFKKEDREAKQRARQRFHEAKVGFDALLQERLKDGRITASSQWRDLCDDPEFQNDTRVASLAKADQVDGFLPFVKL